MKKARLFLLLLVAIQVSSQNRIETVLVDSEKLLMKNLKIGINKYLVYMEKPNGDIFNTDVWVREVKINNKTIEVQQNWVNSNRKVVSLNKITGFESIYHYSKKGKDKIEAFDYYPNEIKGSDSIANNLRKGFELKLIDKPFNWELDLEFFQLLPYQLNTTFVINFYHPGSKTNPKYYNYKVIGKEKIVGLNGNKIQCWLLKIDYAKNSSAIFYISTKTKEVIKMIETYGKIKRYKLKLL